MVTRPCSCADFRRCNCGAWHHPAHDEGHYVHSETCDLYYGGEDH